MKKIFEARKLIKEKTVRKDGNNKYANYEYFTPELVGSLVWDACEQLKLLNVFSLKADELGAYGELVVYDLEEEKEIIKTTMRTAQAVGMTATNPAQEWGATNTFCERYMLMTMYDIKDNSLDPDAHDNRKTKTSSPKKVAKKMSGEPTSGQKKYIEVLVKQGKIKTLPVTATGKVDWANAQVDKQKASDLIEKATKEK